uniref:Auxin:hydrogen symporter, putative n=1 Tax=Arundo donax TaxID=35708 RepID=A0A0A9ACK2_ARUDO
MLLRASDVRMLKRLDARRAPSRPTRRTCRTGSHATMSSDQNPIL